MNPFETTLMKLMEEQKMLQKREMDLQVEGKLFNEKLFSFLKEHGLPENFSLPELALLAIRKSRA